ncbi:hypothetical protein YH65_06050 [Sulfurovum lithotrophicum]|uniref:Uncharacterized protein n=1 Tax=Sulfurovum lithotrophicum TaxID=206403 RepID=A0A7U4M1A8_9BACT|nr:hypothetical protein [Sulfurovum lithotrophicum]AKF25002.1 hypothetical protein YH65_06050 [Sulfurovum lithotrophicum]
MPGRSLLLATIILSLLSASEKADSNTTPKARIQKAVRQAMEKEKKYAKEQKFYNADEYDFKSVEVDPDTLKDIQTVEPDYNYTDAWGACDNE